MQRRIILTLFFAGVFTIALGLRSPSSEAVASRADQLLDPADTTVSALLSLTVGERIGFTLTITNNTRKRVELSFPNGQTHEFVVLDTLGREVWRWSAGKLFTQVLQNRIVEPKQSLSFQDSWKNPDTTGTFMAVARLASRNYPFEERVLFSYPSASGTQMLTSADSSSHPGGEDPFED